jgi:hypothetical protein
LLDAHHRQSNPDFGRVSSVQLAARDRLRRSNQCGNPAGHAGVAIGLGIVVVAIPLLFAAAAIVSHVSVAWVWIITAALTVIGWAMQIIGHKCFEGNWPALVDNPMHMLMSPMYVFAKLFVALGYRPDLAALIQKSSRQMSRGSPLYPSEGRADAGQHP